MGYDKCSVDIFQGICINSDCKCTNSDPCIKNFVEEKCTTNNSWIKLIEDTSQTIENTNFQQGDLRKLLKKSHRDLLVRWFVQLNIKGEDSYSYFRSLQSGPTKDHLKKMDNCLFSEKAANLILTAIKDGSKPLGKQINFEHNPPVKVITTMLDEKKYVCIVEQKYCVMIIDKFEHRDINTKYSQTGNFDERLQAAFITKLYRINPEWLKNFEVKKPS